MKDALLAVNDLRVKFRTENGVLPALQGISFQLKKARRSPW
ncbi:ABC transporter ATP-binding protein [Brevibacillus agri BAB-2500]|nr:ABC transporter ATP-binding protein [Brevibacillus agri BAB-2500]